jgi:3alpha(or 20beta)-hydroxysteroid dehydrogenase
MKASIVGEYTAMANELEGKVAIITGASRGLGAETARLFAREGARVLLADVLDTPGERVADEIGEHALYVHLDVTREEDWLAAIARAEHEFGRLDILVNNAAILGLGLLEDTSLEDYDQVIRVNQVGPFLGMKCAIPAMRRAGGGSIVNISSVAGLHGYETGVCYTSSKFAVRGMTKVAALELGQYDIRVNAVLPGAMQTGMAADDDITELPFPLGRISMPLEVANLILWLGSQKSSYCTGADFLIDGGALAGLIG